MVVSRWSIAVKERHAMRYSMHHAINIDVFILSYGRQCLANANPAPDRMADNVLLCVHGNVQVHHEHYRAMATSGV